MYIEDVSLDLRKLHFLHPLRPGGSSGREFLVGINTMVRVPQYPRDTQSTSKFLVRTKNRVTLEKEIYIRGIKEREDRIETSNAKSFRTLWIDPLKEGREQRSSCIKQHVRKSTNDCAFHQQ